jgi:hypothetical protein
MNRFKLPSSGKIKIKIGKDFPFLSVKTKAEEKPLPLLPVLNNQIRNLIKSINRLFTGNTFSNLLTQIISHRKIYLEEAIYITSYLSTEEDDSIALTRVLPQLGKIYIAFTLN